MLSIRGSPNFKDNSYKVLASSTTYAIPVELECILILSLKNQNETVFSAWSLPDQPHVELPWLNPLPMSYVFLFLCASSTLLCLLSDYFRV